MTIPLLGLMMGDRNGIGPELVAKLCARPIPGPAVRLAVVGDRQVLEAGRAIAGTNGPITTISTLDEARGSTAPWCFLDRPFAAPSARPCAEAHAAAGREVLETLGFLLDAASAGTIDGIVFAPLNKNAMRLGGLAGEDELDFAVDRLGVPGVTGELNVLDGLWAARVTSHVPLRAVADLLTEARILGAIELVRDALHASGVDRPKLAVAGLNPHAGDGGSFGREEIDVIGPAIETAQRQGLDVEGPVPADTLFVHAAQRGYQGIVTMYHDQGQIALKLMGFARGVTAMGGLPFPVTTPAHGTAYDIAGRGVARVDGLRQAVGLCARMAAARS
jgi:4-hydroxythreonine-4-phosphate dehydrogenase